MGNPLGNIKSVVASAAQTCALTLSGSELCWGVNAVGQLGNGSNIDVARPIEVLH